MPQRIKLLLAIPHLGGGGAERVTWLLARYLDPVRFEIHLALITPDQPGSHPLPPSVTLHRLNATHVRMAWWPLLRFIRSLRPDIILSNMAHLNFLILLLKPFLPRKTSVLIRQNSTASKSAGNPFEQLGYRYLYPRAHAIVCQSQAMADDLAINFGIPLGKLKILHNPIEAPSPQLHSAVSTTLLAVARLSPEKGLDLLLTAFVQLLPCHPELELTILGTGPAAAILRRQAQSLGVENHVHFEGHANPMAHYANAKLFVLPSRHEGMPNALLEAAAHGLPIVATPCSAGVTALLQDQPGIWLSAAISAESLATTLHQAISELATLPSRFEHNFLSPFRLETAIGAYETEIARHAQANHIAFIIPTIDNIGGAERQLLLLAKGLAARSWRVTLIALSGSAAAQIEDLRSSGVAYLSLKMRKAWIDPRGWLRYLRWVRKDRPAIVHAHVPHATWFARCIRPLAPIRVLIDTIHTSQTGTPARQRMYRLTDVLSNHITCVSHAVSQASVKAKIAPAGKIGIIPNGIPLAEVQNTARQNGKRFCWIATGRLSPVKDYPTLLKAFAHLSRATHLTILGTGPEEQALRTLAAELQVADRVQFAGFQSDINPWLSKADAFVLSSLWEGLPVGVLEAATAGLPVVATDGPGTSEAMPPGSRLVPVGDYEALATAMAQIMNLSEAERSTLCAAGRQFISRNFAMSVILDRWESLYSQLLTQNPTQSRKSWDHLQSASPGQQPSPQAASTDTP